MGIEVAVLRDCKELHKVGSDFYVGRLPSYDLERGTKIPGIPFIKVQKLAGDGVTPFYQKKKGHAPIVSEAYPASTAPL